MSLDANTREELQAKVHLLCEGLATSKTLARLESLIVANPAACEYYVRYMQLHGALQLSAMPLGKMGDLPIDDHLPQTVTKRTQPFATPRSPVLGFLDRMMHLGGEFRLNSFHVIAVMAGLFLLLSLVAIVPAYLSLRRAELENAQRVLREEHERQLAANKVKEDEASERRARQNSRALFGAYAKLLSEQNPLPAARAVRDSAAWVYAHGLGQARLTFAVDCRWRDAAPGAGEALTLGRRLVLKSGLAEIVFQNGARTILQGPATLQILSGSGAFLQVGRYTVNVDDPRAKGFVVGTPGMKYTDLGTEFGVVVDANGDQEMHVFRGTVKAEEARSLELGADSKRSPLPPGEGQGEGGSRPHAPRPLLLTAHQAIRVAAPAEPGMPAVPIESIFADEKQFVRDMPRDCFRLFSTGVGLDRGAADPHWEITKISTDAPLYAENKLGKLQQAVVAVPFPGYLQDSREKAQWISNSKNGGNMPGGCRWTFRTRFDLAGFDPSTARIEGWFSVDDYLAEIRLNGKKLAIPAGARNDDLLSKATRLKIEEGFVARENTMEIVIENKPDWVPPSKNTMALCIDWKGTARRALKLKPEE